MRIYFILSLFILISCDSRSPIKSRKGIDFADGVKLELSKLNEVKWVVGKKREAEVSMGLNLKVSVPQIGDEGVEKLKQKYGIDRWVYKVTKYTRGSRNILGFFSYALKSISGVNDYVNINLYYHAASVSGDFRRFHCPAFNHRYRLADFDLVESKSERRNQIYVRRKEQLNADISQVSFAPMIFSTGKSMEGTYQIEVAFFNSSDKRLYSAWYGADQNILVKNEALISVASCRGIKEEDNPLPSSRAPRLEDLQIPK